MHPPAKSIASEITGVLLSSEFSHHIYFLRVLRELKDYVGILCDIGKNLLECYWLAISFYSSVTSEEAPREMNLESR